MTAVSTFISKDGVAIAADSAVTIAAGDNIQKIYNSSTKIFHLSDNTPIAVVVWGEAGHMGVPWGILIREFGLTIKKPFVDFYSYPEALLKFIKKNKKIFKGGQKEESFREDLLTTFGEISERFKEDSKVWKGKKSELLSQTITSAADVYDKNIPYTDSDINDSAKKSQFRAVTDKCIRAVFSIKGLTEEDYLTLAHIAALRHTDMERNDSGILMAGYGGKDIFPSHAIIEDGILGKAFSIGEYCPVSNKDTAILRLLAQNGPANTFIEGIDDGVRHFISKQMEDLAIDLTSRMGADGDSKSRNKLIKVAKKLLADKQAQIDAFISERYTEQFRKSLEFMPLEEMSQLVEMMVKLTAYHSRIYDSHETVGGPIDVAVINRDKVFSWAKKK